MKHQQGFTLMELMIVVVIIGILGGIAYPSYQNQMMQSRRSDATVALLSMASAQEKFYLQNNVYAAPGAEASVGGTGTANGLYTLAITVGDASTFTLTATPVLGGAQANDTTCPTITLTAAGIKGPSTNCW